jgi:hypothetical protein
MCNDIADQASPTAVLLPNCTFHDLQGQLASFVLFALACDMPLFRPGSAEGLETSVLLE